jgi:crotonobetainyl-CoA:carnitine CoA-transferase CaiB-like acyl-CoA transferase
MGGLRHITGFPDRAPTRVGISLGDSLAGVFSTIGVLATLNERHSSGQGQHIDTSIFESVLALTESMVADAHLFGVDRERTGPTLKGIAPSNAYPTRDGHTVIIAANQDTVFRRLCQAMGKPELADDPRFSTHGPRGDHMEEIDAIVSEWSQTQESGVLLDMLEQAGVPAGNINKASDILKDPHVAERGSIAWAEAPGIGTVPMPNVTPRLSRTPGSIRTTGPKLGEHTESVLRDLLGYDPEHVHKLNQHGHI